ncbi:MAG TPA: hypothetical protein PLF01_02175 [Alphaproteobacteria bacterium]|nr:hypothetical protein [Alphaproteobacteria bacterium]
MRKYCLPVLCLILGGCSGGNYQDYLRMQDIQPPTTEKFTHCYNYGCQTKVVLPLPSYTQDKLRKLFNPAPKTAEEERQKVSAAIGIFETDIGEIAGTKDDYHGTFRLYQDDSDTTRKFQQDCVDESTNTTTYLGLLKAMDLLKFHEPAFPTARQPFANGNHWWHQTAVMRDTQSNILYAVDSWFRDNGYPAFVVPLEEWKDGWSPPKLTPPAP